MYTGRRRLLSTFAGPMRYTIMIYLKDLKAGDIQHTDEELALVFRVESLVHTSHKPLEHSIVQRLGEGVGGIDDLHRESRQVSGQSRT